MKWFIVFILMFAFSVASIAQETATTPDEAIIITAPEGWSIEVENLEETEAELREQGFDFDLNFPGVPVTLMSSNSMANVSLTLFYGQELGEYFVTESILDEQSLRRDPEATLLEGMERFTGLNAEEIKVQKLPESMIYYYDVVSTITSTELASIATEDAMSSLGFGVDGEMLDEALGESLANIESAFESITTTTRYYAFGLENTGVVLIEVEVSTEFESDNAQFTTMMNMMNMDVDVDSLMVEFLNELESGPGTPVFEEPEPVEDQPADSSTDSGLNLPDGWYQVESIVHGRLAFSDDPEAVANGFQFKPDGVLLLLDNDELVRGIYEDDYQISFDQPHETIAADMAQIFAVEVGQEGRLEITEQNIGNVTLYSFNTLFEQWHFTFYFFERSLGEYALITAVTFEPLEVDFLRDFAVILTSFVAE